MTLPTSGPLNVSDISMAVNLAGNYSASLNFLNGLITPSQRPSQPQLSAFYGKAWFQNTAQGNCNNGNCLTTYADCGNVNCRDCKITGTVNCINCDTQYWLQNNCNCVTAYNCTQAQTSWNCNCACPCDCFWSDDRLKNNLGTITNSLDKVRQLTGFVYEGNELAKKLGLSTARALGVSANTVNRVIPEANAELLNGEYLTVKYDRLVPLLIEAIKELDVKIDILTGGER